MKELIDYFSELLQIRWVFFVSAIFIFMLFSWRQLKYSRELRNGILALFITITYFVLHGYLENYFYISPIGLAGFWLEYVVVAIPVALFFALIYRDLLKAIAFTILLTFTNFVFGFAHDQWKTIWANGWMGRGAVVAVLFTVLLGIAFVVIRRSSAFNRFFLYVLILCPVLLVFDAVQALRNRTVQQQLAVGPEKPLLRKPDIFLIILDGYAGKQQLSTSFQYSNNPLLDSLEQYGFYLPDSSHANYELTQFSVSSILSMQLHEWDQIDYARESLQFCQQRIQSARAVRYLKDQGYRFFNNSVFHVQNQPSAAETEFLPGGVALIQQTTFFYFFKKYVYLNLIKRFFHASKLYQQQLYQVRDDNETLIKNTIRASQVKLSQPRLSYTHLMLPHYPYYYHSDGRQVGTEVIEKGQYRDKNLYLDYLKYSNKRVCTLVRTIMLNRANEAVVIVMSDHGFRYLDDGYELNNLFAIYLPQGGYQHFPKTMSAVQTFPLLFESLR